MSSRISVEEEAAAQLQGRLQRALDSARRLLELPDEPVADDPAELGQLIAQLMARLEQGGKAGAWRESSARHARELEALHRRFQLRLDAVKRAEQAAAELRDTTSPETILRRAPQQLSDNAPLDRVLLSLVAGGRLMPEAAFFGDDPGATAGAMAAIRAEPPRLEHPLIETELLRRRRATLVTERLAFRMHQPTARVMGWSTYVAAPLVVAGEVIGAIHADARGARELDVLDGDILWTFTRNLADVYESASLRRTLRRQRERSRQFVEWLGARSAELSDNSMQLSPETAPAPDPPSGADAPASLEALDDRTAFGDLLSKRELEVLRLLARGASNGSIASQLVISEATVKFHVVNILRKLHVNNRSAAVARYHRLVHSSQGEL
jgi:DNA-binding NarL/FixJ family response regulator